MSNDFDRVEPSFSGPLATQRTPEQKNTQGIFKKSTSTSKIIKILGLLIMVIIVLLFSGISKIIGKSTGKELAKQEINNAALIEKSVEAVNKKTPIVFGNGITLVNAEKAENKLVYIMKVDDSTKLPNNFFELQKMELENNYCEKMKPLAINSISAEWEYTYLKKKYVITISPSNCRN